MLTHEMLKELLTYDPQTGDFTWRVKRQRIQAGTTAGYTGVDRRVMIGVRGRIYLASRLAVFYMTGKWPTHQIDHKDRNPSNNRWNNLREATHSQNCVNSVRKRKHNLPRGVYKSGNRFYAKTETGGKFIYLGCFATPGEAHQAFLDYANTVYGDFLPHDDLYTPKMPVHAPA